MVIRHVDVARAGNAERTVHHDARRLKVAVDMADRTAAALFCGSTSIQQAPNDGRRMTKAGSEASACPKLALV